jgi:hypothetical protein
VSGKTREFKREIEYCLRLNARETLSHLPSLIEENHTTLHIKRL